ncbi:ATP/GTP-binding protein [Streptomyces sp. NPDC051572]|uniref:GTP-binding protein n=1 Tax=Streptomyces sp. NPDC051572 TaxID=3155802 RepID=UPI00344DE080
MSQATPTPTSLSDLRPDLKPIDHRPPASPANTVKILIAGGFGVGKTTMVGAISEIQPLSTEETLTQASAGIDSLTGVPAKATTTVAMDFGRITFEGDPDAVLMLFGTPGQDRFWFMWEDLASGAIGAIVLADTRRLDGAFPAIDFFEMKKLPFVVAVNCFDGLRTHTPDEIASALDIDPSVIPVIMIDARAKTDVRQVLLTLLSHVVDHRRRTHS